MQTLQRMAVGGAVAAALAFGPLLAAAHGETPERPSESVRIDTHGQVRLAGTVTLWSESGRTLGVRAWGTLWTVRVTDATRLVGHGDATIAFRDIAIGHTVTVFGRVDPSAATTVQADRIVDRAGEPARQVALVGRIVTLLPPDAFTLQRDGGGRLTITLASGATITERDTTKEFRDLRVDQRVKVVGTYDAQTDTLTATAVHLNPEAARILMDLKKKEKPGKGTGWLKFSDDNEN